MECGSLLPLFFLPRRRPSLRFTRARKSQLSCVEFTTTVPKAAAKLPQSKGTPMPAHWYGILAAVFSVSVQFAEEVKEVKEVNEV